MELSRRDFLKAGFVSLGAGIGVPSVFARAAWGAGQERLHGAPLGAGSRRVLVILQLTGGTDTLDFLVPYGPSGVAGYRQYHPATDPAGTADASRADLNRESTIAARAANGLIPESTPYNLRVDGVPVLPLHTTILDGEYAFNPAMQRLARRYHQGQVAVINNLGHPYYNLSHFRAMDIWQSARPDVVEYTGWMGRFFNSYVDPDHPIKALVNGTSIPMVLKGGRPTSWDSPAYPPGTIAYRPVALTDVSSYQVRADINTTISHAAERAAREAALGDLYNGGAALSVPFAALLDRTAADARTSVAAIQGTAAYTPSVTYPRTSLATGFRLLAQVITGGPGNKGLGAKVLHITQGGYDTHSAQRHALYNERAGANYETSGGLLKTLDDALDAFFRDLAAKGWADDVVVLTWTEFGRRLLTNQSNGTDHGKATVMLAIGPSVRGGFYGGPMDFTPLAGSSPAFGLVGIDRNGDMRAALDFRSVYASIIEDWLQTDSVPILNGNFRSGSLPALTAPSSITPGPHPDLGNNVAIPIVTKGQTGGW